MCIRDRSCVVFEALFCLLAKRPAAVKDCSALVTGVILACNLPANIPLWTAVVGCFAAIVVAKQLFGGLGTNFANPALVGRLALFIGFAAHMTNYAYPVKGGIDLVASATTDAVASATPLAAAEIPAGSTLGLLLGQYGGMLGETCSLALILGGVYLILTGTISALIPFSYLGTVAVLSAVTGHDVVVQLLSGGLMLGAFFMATDYVTSPFTRLGKLVFGIGDVYKRQDLTELIIQEGYSRVMVFCNTKYTTAMLSNQLARLNFDVDCLHGDLSQAERNKIMARFKAGELAVLVATDVAARGIDVTDVDAVFNYDVPPSNEYYTHRIGRTGRAKNEGKACLLYTSRCV